MRFRYRGITFGGRDLPVVVTSWEGPTTDLSGETTARLQDDGVTGTPQYLGAGSWQISIATNASDLTEALALAGELETAWKLASVRSSTAPAPLDYSTDEGVTWHRIYGKPGKFAPPTDTVHAKLGVALADLEFIQYDPTHYTATERQATITGAASIVGGLRSPLRSPLRTIATGGVRSGRLENGGDQPSPCVVTFFGPSTNPTLTTSRGRTIRYVGTLAYDQSVVLDARAHTVRLYPGGAGVPGRLDARTLLSDLSVPAGVSDWAYQAVDVSGTSRAVVAWRDAHTALQ